MVLSTLFFRMPIMLKRALIASLFALPLASHANNLLVNGSFEDTVLKSGQWHVLPTINGWSVDLTSGVEIRNNIAGTAQDGVNFVELDTHQNKPFDASTNSSIWQSVHTIAGASYTLSWWYSPRISTAANTNDLSVFWNDTLLMTNTGAGSKSHQWQQFSFDVVGTGGSDVIKFMAGGKQDTYGGSLDNVSLLAAPVPEPGTISLVLAGISAVGLMLFRRRGN